MNVSFLCNEFVDVIDSPMPYIIGSSRAIWLKLYKTHRLECSVYDIDTAKFITLERTPELPPAIKRCFFKTCDIIKPNNELKNSLHLKLATINMLYKLLVGVPDYFRKEVNLPENEKVSAFNLFNFEAYQAQFKGEFYPFMKEFASTQAFSLLIERLHDKDKCNMQWVYNLLSIKDCKIALDKQNQMMLKYLLKMEAPLTFPIEEIFLLYEKHLSSSSLHSYPCYKGIIEHAMIRVIPKINYQKTRKISSVYVFKPYLSKISTSYKMYNNSAPKVSAVRITKHAIATSNIADSRNSSLFINRPGLSAKCTPNADDNDIADEFNNKEKTISESIIHRLICKIRTKPPNKMQLDTYRLRSLTSCCEINSNKKDNSRAYYEAVTKQSTLASKKE